jgi:S-methylmethionine-dependent homocysteine/selenocysteine methylase
MPMLQQRLLPHQTDRLFLTDGGIETWLMYKQGFALPHFCSFQLLDDAKAREALWRYYTEFARIARDRETGYVFCSLTYRASRDWSRLLGLSDRELADLNCRSIDFYRDVAEEVGLDPRDTIYSGCIGPRGDAYQINPSITADSAEEYHSGQVETLRQAGADLVTAMTLNSTAEAIGIVRAARTAGIPSVISFTLDQDRMVGGTHTLRMAIEEVDAATNSAPAYYMINCSHPVDFGPALDNGAWVRRIRGLRANASSLDHGVLCQLGHLEEGDAVELARQHRDLAQAYPHINVYGGCCGTDYVHVRKICEAVYDVMCRPSDAAEGQGHATSAKRTGRPPPTCDI